MLEIEVEIAEKSKETLIFKEKTNDTPIHHTLLYGSIKQFLSKSIHHPPCQASEFRKNFCESAVQCYISV